MKKHTPFSSLTLASPRRSENAKASEFALEKTEDDQSETALALSTETSKTSKATQSIDREEAEEQLSEMKESSTSQPIEKKQQTDATGKAITKAPQKHVRLDSINLGKYSKFRSRVTLHVS